jgi:Tfp pilus assembly protein PilN
VIRINLLPRTVRRRRGRLDPFLIVGGVGGVLFLGILGYLYQNKATENRRLEEQIKQARAQLVQNQAISRIVDQYKADQKRVEDKLNIIRNLEASQQGPGRILDELSRTLPGEIWLTNLSKSGTRLIIQGYAFTPWSVAELMGRLQQAGPLFSAVELAFVRKAAVERVPVEQFEIACLIRG